MTLLRGNIPIPAKQCLIVVGSGINHTVICVVMRQIITGISSIPLIKGKLYYFHVWITALFHKTLHRVSHETKVLSNNILVSQPIGNSTEKIHSRSFFPPAAFCILITIWNRIIFIKSTEMINADNIIHIKAMCQTFDPPLESGIFMHIPSVQRISPKLSCCRKSIWRTSGYLCRLVIFIQFEKSWICPGICTVHGNIDRNISDNTNSSSVCIRFQFRPLLIKFELHILLEFNFKIQFFSVIIQCIVPTKANVLRPFCPRNSSKTIFHRHKKCIIAKPVRLLLLESYKVRILGNITSLISFTKKFVTSFVNFLIIHIIFSGTEIHSITLFFRKHSLFNPVFQTDKIRISCKGGKRLIR